MIERALFSILTTNPGVSALVGDRVYPAVRPQDAALPAITFARIGTRDDYSHDGPTDLSRPRFQVSAWSRDALEAKTLANHVNRAIAGYRGSIGGVSIQAGLRVDRRDLYEDDTKIHQEASDFDIWHREAE